jgi:hypothetical protein
MQQSDTIFYSKCYFDTRVTIGADKDVHSAQHVAARRMVGLLQKCALDKKKNNSTPASKKIEAAPCEMIVVHNYSQMRDNILAKCTKYRKIYIFDLSYSFKDFIEASNSVTNAILHVCIGHGKHAKDVVSNVKKFLINCIVFIFPQEQSDHFIGAILSAMCIDITDNNLQIMLFGEKEMCSAIRSAGLLSSV